ncbi:unnamed protein product [Echinostoma caproni]|uniref:Retrotrans_gag domain-containing protein n=1 Tax=Echinostoma caproni TaxID=27848 RepID=A0A183BE83_9TREM|nr:unnamed protein product [Echinostoma caproni]
MSADFWGKPRIPGSLKGTGSAGSWLDAAFPDSPISLSFESLKTLLLKHLQPANFEAAERAKFQSLTRGGSQPVYNFIVQLQTQASRCNFGDHLQTQLRDRIIAGINCPELQQKLLLMHDCTFQSAKKVCEQYQDVGAIICDEPNLLLNASNSKQSPSRRKRLFEKGSKTPSNISSPAHNPVDFKIPSVTIVRNYIPVQMSKTVQKNPEYLKDYSTKPNVITEDRSFVQAAADVVVAHEL